MTKLTSLHQRLVELNARLDSVVEFVTPQERYKGQTPESNIRRGIGIGLLGGGVPGIIAGAQDASKFQDAGIVYRKRDVFGNALAGTAAGIGTAAGVSRLTRVPLVGIAAGWGAGYGVQRGLAAHTLKKRKAVYAGQ